MDEPEPTYISVEEAARVAGMTPAWVRKQIRDGRLPARFWQTGERRTYRITRVDWAAFVARYSGPADDVRHREPADDVGDEGG